VELVPDVLEADVLYISIPYRTAVHLCCCGCGVEVATPLGPADWRLTFDGETVTLQPSIGNWSLPCQSHYWIRHNRVVWARAWTPREVSKARQRDRAATKRHLEALNRKAAGAAPAPGEPDARETLWGRLRRSLFPGSILDHAPPEDGERG